MASKSAEFARSVYYTIAPEQIVLIGIDTVDGDEHVLAADLVNHEPPDESFIRNVKKFGVFTPILARKTKVTGPDGETSTRVEAIAGRTRVLAAREANRRLEAEGAPTLKIPVIFKVAEERVLAGMIVSENEMRRTTTPLEKARALQRAYARGITREEAAELFNKVPASIERWERLISLHPDVIKRVEDGEINATAALAVADLPHDQQVQALEEAIGKVSAAGKRTSGAGIKRGAKGVVGHKALTPKTFKKMHACAEADDLLHPMLRSFLKWIITGDDDGNVEGLSVVLSRIEKKPKATGERRAVGRPRKEAGEAPKGRKTAKDKTPKGRKTAKDKTPKGRKTAKGKVAKDKAATPARRRRAEPAAEQVTGQEATTESAPAP